MPEVEPLVPDLTSLEAEIEFGGRQIIGTRAGQEDCYGVIPPNELGTEKNNLLVIIADGMGGHAAGEVASSIAVDVFADQFLSSSHDTDAARLWDALESANDSIGDKIASSDGELKGMGTTLVAVLLRDLSMRWISVGDSPLYILRSGQLKRLNAIHTYAESLDALASEGAISEEEAQSDSERNVLNSALIGDVLYHVDDSEPFDLRVGDVIIAATDGINTLSEEQLIEIVESHVQEEASSIVENILDRISSENRPRQDNATAVVIKVSKGVK